MADYFTQTAQLVPYAKRPRGATGFVTVFTDEPRPDDPAYGLGNFYAVIEVVSGGREAEEAVQLTLQTAQETYYASEGPDDLLDRFELATKAVNRALTDYVNRGNAGWVGKMSGVMAVLEEDNLHLAYTGSAEAFLYRGAHATHITVQPHGRIQQPSKIFGSIASGKMEIGDKLLLATPALVHHLALTSLKTAVSENSPASAVTKLTQLLDNQSSDRIAALVLEFSTPELAAQTAAPDTPVATLPRQAGLLDGARTAAAPIIGEAAGKSAQLAERASEAARRQLPQLRKLGWNAAGAVRPILQSPKGRGIAGALGAALFVAVIWSSLGHGRAVSSNQSSSQISQLIASANADQQRVIDQDASVRPELEKLETQLAKLNTPANAGAWKKAGTDPATLKAQLSSDIDQLDHVISIAPAAVGDLSKAGQPQLLGLTSQSAVTVGRSGTLAVTDLASGRVQLSSNHLSGVISLSTSSAGDGVYLLTNQPAVYLYKPASDTLTQISGGWGAGRAIASYAGNLYELGSDGVSKRVPTATGFSAGSVSLPAGNPNITNASVMAIDGAIYLGGPSGISRFVAGTLTGHLAVPSGFSGITSLTPGNGDYVLAADSRSGRMALISSQTAGLSVSAEYSAPGLVTAVLDVTRGKIYAVSGSKLVSYSLPR